MLLEDDKEKLLFDIIENKKVTSLFQPIVNLRNGSILGFEALSRGPKGSIFEDPLEMFDFAKRMELLYSLEQITRESAIYKAKDIDKDIKLFINVDPNVVYDKEFKRGFTSHLLENTSLSEKNIVFEITEKSHISDLSSFKILIDHYRKQGYKMAIDDTGAGYSGLQSIISILFDFIKIDRSLISNIDKNPVKYALLETFVNFSRKIKSYIIAEGIETMAELNTLIELGVDYGQGYLISRPSMEFKKEYPLKNYIMQNNSNSDIKLKKIKIGDIASLNITVQLDTETEKIVSIFENNNTIQSVVVLDKNSIPVGIVMREKLYHKLGSKYGYAVYMERAVDLIMDKNPMIINYKEAIADVSKMAMQRDSFNVYDCIIVEKKSMYYGTVSIKSLLEEVSTMRIEEAKQLNPLTKLPGNKIIENEIKSRLKNKEVFSVLYIDLDNFKAYNDCYGYMMGDKVLTMSAKIIKNSINYCGNQNDFVGHIGGDDFVLITDIKKDIEISNYIIRNFNKEFMKYLKKDDFNKGHYICVNRQGMIDKILLTSISIAIVSNENIEFTSHLQISDIAAEIKKKAKNINGSVFVKNKRQFAY